MLLHGTETTKPWGRRLSTEAEWDTGSRGVPSHHPPEQRLQDPGENYSTAYTPGDGKNNACNANDKPPS